MVEPGENSDGWAGSLSSSPLSLLPPILRADSLRCRKEGSVILPRRGGPAGMGGDTRSVRRQHPHHHSIRGSLIFCFLSRIFPQEGADWGKKKICRKRYSGSEAALPVPEKSVKAELPLYGDILGALKDSSNTSLNTPGLVRKGTAWRNDTVKDRRAVTWASAASLCRQACALCSLPLVPPP